MSFMDRPPLSSSSSPKTSSSESHDAPRSPYSRPPRHSLHRRKTSLMDEIIPLPVASPSRAGKSSASHVLRRTGSLAIVSIFLLSILFLAVTNVDPSRPKGWTRLFKAGSNPIVGTGTWVVETTGEVNNESEELDALKTAPKDFDQFTMLNTLKAKELNLTAPGQRLIFIGDVHGSYDPLQRLMSRLNYDNKRDTLIHVGDLVAKGENHIEVLDWMIENNIQGVRGNHDQPVIQWRSWMQWAAGDHWKDFVKGLEAEDDDDDVVESLRTKGKMYPKEWHWKGEHSTIAKSLEKRHFDYLRNLPLTLHIPSLHSIVVHAGLLPHNPLKSLSDASQPLVAAAESSDLSSSPSSRLKEELALLFDVPQNTDPWTLMDMRSVYGKKLDKVTSDGKVGTPWSDVWNQEIQRCTRSSGKRSFDDDEEEDQVEIQKKKKKGKGKFSKIDCSPVSVIYGHAAGRGLDIKPWSKGIDTGCVYGKSLTALVLGDLSGLQGDSVTVGDHHGVLVDVECEEGGL